MTNEEFNRKIEFLLDQQAKFEARMQSLQEAQAKSERKLDETAEVTRNNKEAVIQLISAAAHLTETTIEGFHVVFDGMQYFDEKLKHTDERIDVLVDSQIRTDERLRDLTALFERHIREDHRGLNGA